MQVARLKPRRNHFALSALALAVVTSIASATTPIAAPGMREPGLVSFSAGQIPLIQAQNDYDAAYMLGYVHARDRFFQMDVLRRTASGTLGELVGASALASDVQLRTLGLRRAAQATWSGMNDEMRGVLKAYTDGVNNWLRPGQLPPEYSVLELTRAEPWTPVDSIVIGKILAFQLSFDLDVDYTIRLGAYQRAGAASGFNGSALFFEDTHRVQPFDDRVSITAPDGTTAAKVDAAPFWESMPMLDTETVALAQKLKDSVSNNPVIAPHLRPRENRAGSNWWMIHGSKTASGSPILANDPHLSLGLPAVMHQAHIISRDPRYPQPMNVSGLAPPGTPNILLGCTEAFCWGLTTNPLDVTDAYQERFVLNTFGLPTHTIFQGRPEPVTWTFQSYFLNQLDGVNDNVARTNSIGFTNGGVTITVPRRNNGPVLSINNDSGVSVQYTGWGPTFELDAIRRINRATNLNEFRDALDYFDVGSQNFAYAGRDGTIAYYTSAEMPVREDLQANIIDGTPPFILRDGTGARKNEWLSVVNPQPNQAVPFEILKSSEMPQDVNPASGYLANANNDPVGNTLDNNAFNQLREGGGLYYLNFGYSSLRQGRIDRMMQSLLARPEKVTLDDIKATQANNQMLDAELVSPFLIAAYHNALQSNWPELKALAENPRVKESVDRIAAWDFSTPTGIEIGYDPGDTPEGAPPTDTEIAHSVAATLFAVWRGQAIRGTIDRTLTEVGLESHLPGSSEAYVAFKRLLDTFPTRHGVGASGLNFFQVINAPNAESARDFLLLKAMADALTLLASDEFAPAFAKSTQLNDYRWGKLHRIVFEHPLHGPFDIPGQGVHGYQNVAENLPGFARAGGYESVDASSHSARADTLNDFMFSSGPARRFVGEMTPLIHAEQIYPGGQSGDLRFPAYTSQLTKWLINQYEPLYIDEAEHQSQVSGEFVLPFDPTLR
ncbi:penicillin acylase family protein [Ahniella affigens]|uniref:Penicillin acylase family protein n=1 Tax=Ahniella affigens TaxID=2021234 RepID=A0A2P1PPS3_9GAMM|nr:penicillin acylase family protein [Ahniella affigens]AVP96834.1 penicillin acylase family protein [Ahniella affigens]